MSGKRSAGGHGDEETPLLADDTMSQEDGTRNTSAQDGPLKATQSKKPTGLFGRMGRWISRNRMVVAILFLLLGGFIALCIYLGCGSWVFSHLSNMCKSAYY